MDSNEKSQIMSFLNPLKCKQHLKCCFSILYLCCNLSSVFSLKQFQTPAFLLLILGAYQALILNDSCASPLIIRGMEDIFTHFSSDEKWCREMKRVCVSRPLCQGKRLGSVFQRSRCIWTTAVAFLSGSRAYSMAFAAEVGKFTCMSHSGCSCKNCRTT